jgi:hypothetical protein
MINRKNRHVSSPSKGHDKANPFKLDAKVKSLINDLDLAGRKYRQRLQGHHEQVYASMQTAQRAIAECLKSKSVYSEFSRAVQGKEENARSRSRRFNLSLEAMARSMGAFDAKARKLASKRAKVLDYLRKIGVKVNDTAATVKKDGLEKLRTKASNKPKKPTKSRQRDSSAKQTLSPRTGPGAPRAGHNDTETFMSFYMKRSDKDQLLESRFGAMLTVVVSRVSEDDGDIQVHRVVSGDQLDDFAD